MSDVKIESPWRKEIRKSETDNIPEGECKLVRERIICNKKGKPIIRKIK